jgi:hypothetical protein
LTSTGSPSGVSARQLTPAFSSTSSASSRLRPRTSGTPTEHVRATYSVTRALRFPATGACRQTAQRERTTIPNVPPPTASYSSPRPSSRSSAACRFMPTTFGTRFGLPVSEPQPASARPTIAITEVRRTLMRGACAVRHETQQISRPAVAQRRSPADRAAERC